MPQYWFAWVDPTEDTFGDAHKREDEHVYSFRIEHNEGDFAALEVVIENPRVGLLAPSRKVWAWFALGDKPLFFGRLVAMPDDLDGDYLKLSFLARPGDYEDQRKTVAAEKANVWPYYDRIWFSKDDLDNPDNVLEARPELWHIDRVTHEVTTSNISEGEDGTIDFDESMVFYDSVQLTHGATPYRRVNVTASVSWAQAATGAVSVSGLWRGRIKTYTGQGFIDSWPKEGAGIGGGWSVGKSSVKFANEDHVPIWEWHNPPDGRWRFVFNDRWEVRCPDINWGAGLPPLASGDWPEEILAFPIQIMSTVLQAAYDVSRDKSETLTFSLEADTQAVVTEPGDAATLDLAFSSAEIVSRIDPGGLMPIRDVRKRAYFTQDRGTLSVEYLIALARARLLASARCVDVTFSVPLSDALDGDLSLRKNASLQDHRLPGYKVAGKVKSYVMTGDGDTGAFTCDITIGCSVGYGGEPAEPAPGDPTYVEIGYVEAGYQRMDNQTVVPQASGVRYTSIAGIAPNDDGIDFERLDIRSVIKSHSITGTYQEQQQAMTHSAMKPEDVFTRLKTKTTKIDFELKPLTGGPFQTNYSLVTSPLVIPKTIDLESESSA